MTELRTVRVAAIQATPVVLDADATVAKACRLLGEAAADGAELAVLPETFVSLYPSNAWARAAVSFNGQDELWERMWASAVDVPGPHVDALAAACAEHGIHCAIGVNERESERPGTLYNTLLLIGPEGLLHKHRKLMPTMQERVFHGFGTGNDLGVTATPAGRVGGLICWENRMPLARWSVYHRRSGSRRQRTTRTAGRRRCDTSRSSPAHSSCRYRSTSPAARSRTTSRRRWTASVSTVAAGR